MAVFVQGIPVLTKAGSPIGVITTGVVGAAPSSSIATSQGGVAQGGFQFHLPVRLTDPLTGDSIPNPDAYLVHDGTSPLTDRIVLAGNTEQLKPWIGTITSVEIVDGSCIVSCEDLWGQFTGVEMKDAIKVVNKTPAAVLIQMVVSQLNEVRARDGELQWDTDIQVGAAFFFGDDSLSGDFQSSMTKIAQQSFVEYAIEANLLPGGGARGLLVARERFDEGEGVALTDTGPGANIVARPSLTLTSPAVNMIRMTGQVTQIEKAIPEGATPLPVPNYIPVAEIWGPTYGYRRRMNTGASAALTLEVDVPYSLPPPTQIELGNNEAEKFRTMFAKFIEAYHDRFGRPWDDGWAWTGPDSLDLLPRVTLKDYVNFRQVASARGPDSSTVPIAIVMKHKTANSYVKVHFDPITYETITTISSSLVTVDNKVVYDFEWRRLPEYSPQTHGVAGPKTKTVNGGIVTTALSIVRWGVGDQIFVTQLLQGIQINDVLLPVYSIMGFPDKFPFIVTVGGDEKVEIDYIDTQAWTSLHAKTRGYGGTPQRAHRLGEVVEYDPPGLFTDLPPPDNQENDSDPVQPPDQIVPWPDGLEYISKLLALLNRPGRVFSAHLANVAGSWRTIKKGSTHNYSTASEGPAGISCRVRVLGFAPNVIGKSMELILEEI